MVLGGCVQNYQSIFDMVNTHSVVRVKRIEFGLTGTIA